MLSPSRPPRGPNVLQALGTASILASPLLGAALPSLSTPHNGASKACAAPYAQITQHNSSVWPVQNYKSSHATPPQLKITKSGEPLAHGLLFFSPSEQDSLEYPAPIIMTDTGDLIWNGPKGDTSNFRTTMLDDKPVISYWAGQGSPGGSAGGGHGYGQTEIYDTNYKLLHTVCPKLGLRLPEGLSPKPTCEGDVHESFITSRGTLLVTAYNITQADLSQNDNGPKDGWIYNPVAVEVDIKTNKVVWQWAANDHVPVTDSHLPRMGTGVNESVPFDYFHMNSIQQVGEDYWINGRLTWATYMVGRDGKIKYTIKGDTGGDFGKLPEDGGFKWAHYARIEFRDEDNFVMRWFDNENRRGENGTAPSKGLAISGSLPPGKDPLRLYTALVDKNQPLYADTQGSYDILPNGNHFMGYGQVPFMKEYGPPSLGQDVRFTAQFGPKMAAASYRSYRSEWHATPATELDLAIEKAAPNDALNECAGKSDMRGFVSWNGATDVTDYVTYAGSDERNLHEASIVPKKGFETEFVIPDGAKYVQVGAIEGKGKEPCRKSKVVCVD